MFRVLRPGGSVIVNVAALDMLKGDHSALGGEVRRYTKTGAAGQARARRISGAAPHLHERVAVSDYGHGPRAAASARREAREQDNKGDFYVPPAPINALFSGAARRRIEDCRSRHRHAGRQLAAVPGRKNPGFLNQEIQVQEQARVPGNCDHSLLHGSRRAAVPAFADRGCPIVRAARTTGRFRSSASRPTRPAPRPASSPVSSKSHSTVARWPAPDCRADGHTRRRIEIAKRRFAGERQREIASGGVDERLRSVRRPSPAALHLDRCTPPRSSRRAGRERHDLRRRDHQLRQAHFFGPAVGAFIRSRRAG